jgi:DNA-binding NtrC family response regulator
MYHPFDEATELMCCFGEAALAVTDSPRAEIKVLSPLEEGADLRIELGNGDARRTKESSSRQAVFPILYQKAELGWMAIARPASSLGGVGVQACEWIAKALAYHLKRHEVGTIARERHGREAVLIGTSEPLSQVDLFLERASRTLLPALILGCPGSEAESIALALHLLSPVRSGPFVQANCATLDGASFERRLLDLLRSAEGGTLLLAHLEHTDLQNQHVLCEILETGPRLWTGRHGQPVSVRLLATATRDLDWMAQRGEIHSGLLERLDFLRLEIEPLRNRREDIRPLIEHNLRRHSWNGVPEISEEVLQACIEYDWPGDVLELSRVVARLAVMSGEDCVLPRHVRAYAPQILTGRGQVSPQRLEAPRVGLPAEGSPERFLSRLDSCHPALRRAIDQMTAHPQAKMSLAGVAASTNVSSSHLAHLFQKDLGTTFTRFLSSVRIDRAKHFLLEQPREAITTIATETGFSDLRHFERTFKGAVGCTPKEFRRLAGVGRQLPATS